MEATRSLTPVACAVELEVQSFKASSAARAHYVITNGSLHVLRTFVIQI